MSTQTQPQPSLTYAPKVCLKHPPTLYPPHTTRNARPNNKTSHAQIFVRFSITLSTMTTTTTTTTTGEKEQDARGKTTGGSSGSVHTGRGGVPACPVFQLSSRLNHGLQIHDNNKKPTIVRFNPNEEACLVTLRVVVRVTAAPDHEQ